jgi:hypothetical protein
LTGQQQRQHKPDPNKKQQQQQSLKEQWLKRINKNTKLRGAGAHKKTQNGIDLFFSS